MKRPNPGRTSERRRSMSPNILLPRWSRLANIGVCCLVRVVAPP
ncbi:MAG: hypothetical protein IH877_07315 [Gemmatimonadetes bacterium]|nr:hypothetical protein [Gemmatimonadota bacterium]